MMQTREGFRSLYFGLPHSLPLLLLLLLVLLVAAGDVSAEPAASTTSQADDLPNEKPASCEALEAKAASAESAAARCRASLEAARCILDSQCSTALTRELSGASDQGELSRAAASRVLSQLSHAEKALEELDPGEEVAAEARACIELMRTFATLFQSLGGATATTGPAREELLSACAALAEYFDHPRGGVAESAKFWQGIAYRRAGRAERALSVLRPVLGAPAARRIGLWARLERCRALGDREEYAAGVALSLRISARVDAWFGEEDPTTRKQAVDSVRWVRIELLRDWAKKLKKDGMDERAKEAEEEADRLLGSDSWPPGIERWLSVGPPVADLPECRIETTSRPADEP